MTTRRQYLEALQRLEWQIGREYLNAISEAVRRASVDEIEAGVVARDIEEIARNIGIGSAALSMTTEAIRTGFIEGGQLEAPVARIVFDIRNPRAEAWLSRHSSDFVTRISNSQREAIRIVLTYGMEAGRNPRQTALDIVGRVGASGRRTGGIVGLTEAQAGFVANARAELLGNAESMASYFTRTRRDRRFDSIVRRAMDEGRAVDSADVDRIVGRYADRLLQTRGEAIARTESIAALSAGREQAANQAVEEGVIASQFVTRIWSATGDSKMRDAHREMNRQQRGFGQPFQSPTGALMMHPGDTSLGAGAEDVINCRCHEIIRYDFIGEAAARLSNG